MFRCTVYTPTSTQAYEAVKAVVCSTGSGEIEILPGHAEAFFILIPGPIVIDQGTGDKIRIDVLDAACRVSQDSVEIVTR